MHRRVELRCRLQLPGDAPIIGGVRRDNESVQQWCERAIIADSMAASQLETLGAVGNDAAQTLLFRRVEQAAAELERAMNALQTQRQQQRDLQPTALSGT